MTASAINSIQATSRIRTVGAVMAQNPAANAAIIYTVKNMYI